MPSRCLHWRRVLEDVRRSGRPSLRVCGRLFEGVPRPYDGHNKGQGFFDHQDSPLDGHHTQQAFYHHIPSGVEETWGGDGRQHRVEHGASVNGRGDNRGHRDYNGHRERNDRLDVRHGDHHDGSCQDRHAIGCVELKFHSKDDLDVPRHPKLHGLAVHEGPCRQVP